jgi:hypothetical protein
LVNWSGSVRCVQPVSAPTMTAKATRRPDHGRRGVVRFGCCWWDEMIGNKAGFNDSIEE